MAAGVAYPFVEALVLPRRHPSLPTLDVGCGAGVYRRAVGPGYVGLDVSAAAYDVAPEVYGNAAHLPFRNSTFGVVFCVAMLYMVPEPAPVLAEWRRVLAPGGTLLVFDYQRPVIEGHRRRVGGHHNVWTSAELRSMVEGAGLREIVDRSFVSRRLRYAGVARWIVRNGRRLRGDPGTWSIIEARR
jgi:SAM-dependent methyltransferase